MKMALPALIAAAAIPMTGCAASPPQEKTQVTDTRQAEGATILKRIGLDLPATATVDYAEQISGRDDAARLSASMSASDWKSLKARLPASAADPQAFSPDANFHLGPDEGAWQPSRATGLTTVQLPWRDGAESLNLGFAPADGEQVRVFLFWHQL